MIYRQRADNHASVRHAYLFMRQYPTLNSIRSATYNSNFLERLETKH